MIRTSIKKVFQQKYKNAQPLCIAKPDCISIRRSELIQELFKAHNIQDEGIFISKY